MPRLLLENTAGPGRLPTAPSSAFGADAAVAMQGAGRMTQALGQVLDQYAQSDSRARAVRYEMDLRTEAQAMLLDPDIVGREKKFEDAQRRIYSKYRPSLGPTGLYDDRAGMAAHEVRSSFLHQTMVDGITESRRNTQIEVQHKALKAARAETDEESLGYLAEIRTDLEAAGLYMTPGEQTVAIQDAIGTSVRAMVDTNPKRALGIIDSLGTMLNPEVIAVYRDEAITGIKRAAADEAAAAKEAAEAAKAVEQAAYDKAAAELFTLDTNGSLSVSAVRARLDALDFDPEAAKVWLDRARSGPVGASGNSGINRDLYVDLSNRAAAGEVIGPEVDRAYLAGELGKTERDNLRSVQADTVFSEARKSVLTRLDPKSFPKVYAQQMNLPGVQADAVRDFDDWARANPNASITDANNKAAEIGKTAIERANLNRSGGRLARFAGLKFGQRLETQDDVTKASAEIEKRRRAGTLTEEAANDLAYDLDLIAQELDGDEQLRGGAN